MSKFITWYLNLKFKQKLLLSFLVIIFLTTLCISGTNYAVSGFELVYSQRQGESH